MKLELTAAQWDVMAAVAGDLEPPPRPNAILAMELVRRRLLRYNLESKQYEMTEDGKALYRGRYD